MAKSLEKMRLKIAKKQKGNLGALHEKSRDSRKLHKAIVRDGRLEKLAASKRKQHLPMRDRAAYFQSVVMEKESRPLTADEIQEAIAGFMHQFDEELAEIKSARRPGRPASAREDLVKMKVNALKKELSIGFLVPDLSNQDNVTALERWEGGWSQLTGINWVKVTDKGAVRPATFPPKE